MKLKTLLMVVAMLCVSLFVVACGGGDDTTATPGTQAPGATTTKAQTTTTKKTTKTTTSKVTTTTVTTTLSPDFFTKIPAKLPNNETYEIHTRYGLDAENDYLSFTGEKYTNLQWINNGIYGNAISFACSMTADKGNPNRAEGTLNLMDPLQMQGVKGVLWYVDFSKLSKNPAQTNVGDGVCTSVTLEGNTYRSNLGGNGTSTGYYLKDGEWVQTTNVNACRMNVPDKFAGWLYVPLSSYGGAGDLYDATTGIGNEKFITKFNLYTDGYTYTDQASVVFDEIIFVK